MISWSEVPKFSFNFLFPSQILSTRFLGKKSNLKLKTVTIIHSATTETVRLPDDNNGVSLSTFRPPLTTFFFTLKTFQNRSSFTQLCAPKFLSRKKFVVKERKSPRRKLPHCHKRKIFSQTHQPMLRPAQHYQYLFFLFLNLRHPSDNRSWLTVQENFWKRRWNDRRPKKVPRKKRQKRQPSRAESSRKSQSKTKKLSTIQILTITRTHLEKFKSGCWNRLLSHQLPHKLNTLPKSLT